jgi:SNF2 family DNA or RNA helicase
MLTGQTIQRETEIKKFQEDPENRIFLISLKAGGTGLNLTAADYVFIIDPWWNPAAEMQAINRAHRIGQDKKVFVYRFITEGSIEEKIQSLQKRKWSLAEKFIHSNKPFKIITKEEIMNLLK